MPREARCAERGLVVLAHEDDFLAAAPMGETERIHRAAYNAFRFFAVQLDDQRFYARSRSPAGRT